MNGPDLKRLNLTTRSGVAHLDALRSRRYLLFATLLTLALWFVPGSDFVLYPLRLFVTFVHESGHAFASVVTGGSVESLHVAPNGSGVTWTRTAPWWEWLMFSGGYLGTALVGALLLQVGRLTQWRDSGRATLYGAAAYILGITLFWGFHPLGDPFTVVAGLSIAALLYGLARMLPSAWADFMAAFIAVQCSLNALSDIRILFHLTTNGSNENDAGFMAQAYLLPPTFWAILWAGIALMLLGASLHSYLRATAPRQREF